MSDNDIINNIFNGNRNDYSLLVEKHQQAIFRICMGYVHNEDDANDLTQEVFINAFQNLHKFKFNAAFSTWLFRISINLSLTFLRTKKRILFERFESAFESKNKIDILSEMDSINPEQILINKEQRLIIQKEIDKLSDKQKTAFILRKYENLSQKEISEIMNITEGAVESLIQRAKLNLQKKLSGHFKKNKYTRRKNDNFVSNL